MNKSEQEMMGVNAGMVLSQLLIFNALKCHRELQSDATATRHDPNRETQLPIYLCPSKLKKSLFTTGSMGNIGHNPRSRTA